jgi:asparagine synthase (glutamine-hydrolysing)
MLGKIVDQQIQSDSDILLYCFECFSFTEKNLKVYYKGSAYKGKDLENWIRLLVDQLITDKHNFNTYLFSELAKTSGLYSLIFKSGNYCFIAGDIIRSIPIFYGFIKNRLIITDNLDEYQKHFNPFSIDNDKLEEFIASGFVYGNGTIFKNVYTLQAGEIVTIKDDEITASRYFEFKPAEKQITFADSTEFALTLDKVLISTFSRMIEQTPDVNHWIIPLSGGHDSRIIVNYLNKLGIRNVICFSYGIQGNEQSEYSRQVAEALDFEWHFVEYSEQKWQNLHDTGITEKYINFAFNGVSTPHLQDFLAVYELIERGIINKGDVFVPGHTFDFLVGSNLQESDFLCLNETMAVERAFRMHSRIQKWSRSPVRTIEDIYDKAQVDPVHFQEYFNWQEKRAKFMVNSIKGYEFLGFEARLPFWDKELVDFWLMIPDNERTERKIFFEAENKGLLVDQLISIPFFGKSDRVSKGWIEEMLSKVLPGSVKTLILRITGHKVKYNAGINQVYALKASSVKDMLKPIEDFPTQVMPYFSNFLTRFPYQIDTYTLNGLYAIRLQLDRNKRKTV